MTKEFYDDFSSYYHLIFNDWDASVTRHANIINQIIHNEWGPNHRSIVDVSRGIGTQAIGLAHLDYDVHASDLSQKAIERARLETSKRELNIIYSIADMRHCYSHHKRQFDILISCDNSVPHLLSDSEILIELMRFAGFNEVKQVRCEYHQPVVIGTKAG